MKKIFIYNLNIFQSFSVQQKAPLYKFDWLVYATVYEGSDTKVIKVDLQIDICAN